MFKINNITKSYSDKIILNDVSTEIQMGTLTGLIGSNGAGKSTLLTIMSRLLRQDSGEIFLDNKRLQEYSNSDASKKIAVLRQTTDINIKLTVRELVSFGRFPHSKGRLKAHDNKIIDDALAFLSLNSMQHKYINQLSGGERQRALIAMAIAQDTPYVLLDEPLNNLDMKHANAIMSTLKRLVTNTGRTVIIVLHDINCAAYFCDDIIALKGSKIFIQGAPETIMQKSIIDEIFDINCQIHCLKGRQFCVHFNCAI